MGISVGHVAEEVTELDKGAAAALEDDAAAFEDAAALDEVLCAGADEGEVVAVNNAVELEGTAAVLEGDAGAALDGAAGLEEELCTEVDEREAAGLEKPAAVLEGGTGVALDDAAGPEEGLCTGVDEREATGLKGRLADGFDEELEGAGAGADLDETFVEGEARAEEVGTCEDTEGLMVFEVEGVEAEGDRPETNFAPHAVAVKSGIPEPNLR